MSLTSYRAAPPRAMSSTLPLVAEHFVSGEVDIGDIGRNEKGECEGKTTNSSGGSRGGAAVVHDLAKIEPIPRKKAIGGPADSDAGLREPARLGPRGHRQGRQRRPGTPGRGRASLAASGVA